LVVVDSLRRLAETETIAVLGLTQEENPVTPAIPFVDRDLAQIPGLALQFAMETIDVNHCKITGAGLRRLVIILPE
jgi:hypothetical protein